MGPLGKVLLALVKVVVLTWGFLTAWAYRVAYGSRRRVKNFNKVTKEQRHPVNSCHCILTETKAEMMSFDRSEPTQRSL